MSIEATPNTAIPTSDVSAFVDRRSGGGAGGAPGRERRQFANSHQDLSADGGELARAIDRYKLQHRRRFINADELLKVISELGYSK